MRVASSVGVRVGCPKISILKSTLKHKVTMAYLGYGFHTTHPGEILKDEIEYRGISQRKLAAQMGISYTVLNEILNTRRPLTANTALLFEAALGIEADTLMRVQTKYNMQTARKDKSFSERLAKIRKAAALI
jgi:addiction module HigA family antidote